MQVLNFFFSIYALKKRNHKKYIQPLSFQKERMILNNYMNSFAIISANSDYT